MAATPEVDAASEVDVAPNADAAPDSPAPTAPAEPDATLPPQTAGADPTALSPEELARRQLQAKIEQATEHYKEGKRLYGSGLYVEAAIEFERSYAAVPAANTLYAASLAYGRAGKTVEAVRSLERYLALPDCSQWPPEQRPIDCTELRADAEKSLAEQRRRVGELTLKIADGVELREIRVGGRTIPVEDFPLLMLPGTVDVELFGMGPDDRRTRPAYITGGEVYEVYVAPFQVDIIPTPPVVGGDPVEDDRLRREQRQRRLKITFWSGVGLTAASGVAAGVMGGLTRYYLDRFYEELCEANCHELDENGDFVLDENGDPIPLDTGFPLERQRTFERYKPVTNALVGVTIGLGVTTALVGAFAFRKRGEQERAGPTSAHVRLGASGLVVRW